MVPSRCPASGAPAPVRVLARCRDCGGLTPVDPGGTLAPHRPPGVPAGLAGLDRLMRRRRPAPPAP